MQLIKGSYSKNDALEIIQQIVGIKIKFHEDKIAASDSEEDIKMRETRIRDLQNDLTAFRIAIKQHSGSINMNSLLSLNNTKFEKHDFKLINGSFDYDDARDVLLTAYKNKINFHKVQAWSKSERGEPGVDAHTARALELEIEAESIKELLKTHLQSGKGKVSIKCSVSLEFETDDENIISQQKLIHSH